LNLAAKWLRINLSFIAELSVRTASNATAVRLGYLRGQTGRSWNRLALSDYTTL